MQLEWKQLMWKLSRLITFICNKDNWDLMQREKNTRLSPGRNTNDADFHHLTDTIDFDLYIGLVAIITVLL